MDIYIVQFQRLFVEVLRYIPDVQLALLQRDELRIGSAEVLENNAFKLGRAAVVVLIAYQFHKLIALGADKLERPRANIQFRRVPGRRVVFDNILGRYAVEDMRRQNLQICGGRQMPAYIGIHQLEHDREVIGRVRPRQLIRNAIVEVLAALKAADPTLGIDVCGLRHDELDRFHHIVRRHRFAVMPFGVLAKFESVGRGIVRDVPLERQVRVRIVVAIEVKQAAMRQHRRRIAAVAILVGWAEGAVRSPRRSCGEGHRAAVLHRG